MNISKIQRFTKLAKIETEKIKKFIKSEEIEAKILKEYCEILSSNKIILFFSLTIPQIKYVVSEYNKMGNKDLFRKEFTEAISDLFDKEYFLDFKIRIEQMIKNHFRKKMATDIIDLHIEEKYHLAIPLTIIQIEGLIREYFSYNEGFSIDEYINKLLLKKYKKMPYNFFEMDNEIKKVIKNIYKRLEHTKENKNLLNRNLILHGISVDYANEFSSIQCIFLLEYIIYMVKEE